MLDKETFTDSQVANFINANYVSLRIDAEKGEGPALKDAYRVPGFPTVVFLHADSTEVDRIVGYLPPEPFLATAQDYHANKNTLADYLQQLEDNPENAELHYQVAMKYNDRGMSDKVEAHLAKVLELDPDNTSGYVDDVKLMAAQQKMRSDIEGAIADLQALVAEYPDQDKTVTAYQMLARCYEQTEDLEKAVTAYRQAVELEPDNANLLNGYAWFLAGHDRNLDEALQVATKAVELDPKNTGIIDTLAEVHFKRGEFDKAIEVINTALELDPDDGYLKEQLEKFTKAKSQVDVETS